MLRNINTRKQRKMNSGGLLKLLLARVSLRIAQKLVKGSLAVPTCGRVLRLYLPAKLIHSGCTRFIFAGSHLSQVFWIENCTSQWCGQTPWSSTRCHKQQRAESCSGLCWRFQAALAMEGPVRSRRDRGWTPWPVAWKQFKFHMHLCGPCVCYWHILVAIRGRQDPLGTGGQQTRFFLWAVKRVWGFAPCSIHRQWTTEPAGVLEQTRCPFKPRDTLSSVTVTAASGGTRLSIPASLRGKPLAAQQQVEMKFKSL